MRKLQVSPWEEKSPMSEKTLEDFREDARRKKASQKKARDKYLKKKAIDRNNKDS